MAKLTHAQKLAYCKMILEILRQQMAELKAMGLDAAKMIEELDRKLTEALQLEAKQEAAKAALAELTAKAVKAMTDSYKLASSDTDAMVGTYGKDSHKSKRLRQIRDQMVLEGARKKREKKQDD